MENQEEIGHALGKIPSGVAILTTKEASSEFAMMASWFQQVAFDPPMVSVAVKKDRPIAKAISKARVLALSLFHINQKELFGHFAKGTPPGQSPFEGVSVLRKKTGSALLSEAMAFLDCELVHEVDAGDHTVFFAKIVEGGLLNEGHSMVHLRRNGFHY